jgi:hypothetical protein
MKLRTPIAFLSFLVAVVALAGGLAVWGPPALRAAQEAGKRPHATLQITVHPPRILFSTADGEPSSGGIGEYERYMNTQRALIQSQLILDAALAQPAIRELPSIKNRPDAVAWLQQVLEVRHAKDNEILQLSMAASSGASSDDQAAIINAVVRAYMDEVVNVETRRRADRHAKLKKIKDNYAQALRERQDTLRKLSEQVGTDEPVAGVRKDVLSRLYYDLRSQRVQLKLERAEAETLLGRRQKTERTAPGSASKEIEQIEDRLAILGAREAVIAEELKQMDREIQTTLSIASQALDLASLHDEISQLRDAAQKVGAEIEKLNIELEAPPRVRLVESAVPTR